jgi:hypothetical protein
LYLVDMTKTIKYRGDPARASGLVQMLEHQGVQVSWSPPREQRGLGADINEVLVSLVSTGSAVGIGTAVKQFRQRFPKATVKIDGEPDDGGFLDG